jgi:hypothetical protein
MKRPFERLALVVYLPLDNRFSLGTGNRRQQKH